MGVLKGDFISFSFNGVHSSDLGIIRTSDGNRFNKNLYPTIQDKTVQVPGADGTYFFNSYYTLKNFNIPIAFDSLTEEGIRRIEEVFGKTEELVPLIFDETPYKYYMVKTTGTPTLKYIPFDETELNGGERVYKGEGTLTFIAYYPYAKSVYKFLDEYTMDNMPTWHDYVILPRWEDRENYYIIENGKYVRVYIPPVNEEGVPGVDKYFTEVLFKQALEDGVVFYYNTSNQEEWAGASGMLAS